MYGIEEKLRGPGYIDIRTGNFIPKEDACDYAMERISRDKEEKEEFEEWYFSDNFIKEGF